MATNNYAHPEALVDTDWLAQHLKDDGIRIVESNEDILLYDTGHIPGAVHIDWRADLQDPVIRDYIQPDKFAELCSRNGITPETTRIFYGDKSNWKACSAAVTFPAPRVCRGKPRARTTRRSNRETSFEKFTWKGAVSRRHRTPLFIAASASAPVTPGSFSRICSG